MHASANNDAPAEEWIQCSTASLQGVAGRLVNSTMLNSLVTFTFTHLKSTIPLEWPTYIEAACVSKDLKIEPESSVDGSATTKLSKSSKIREFSAVWTYGIMAFVALANQSYIVNDITWLLHILATRRSLISSLSMDSLPPVYYIKEHPEKFDSSIIHTVFDIIFKSSNIQLWPYAPIVTSALVKSALERSDTTGILALQTWCQNAETVSIGLLDKTLRSLILRHKDIPKKEFLAYIRNRPPPIELQIFDTLYKVVSADVLGAIPLASLKESYKAFGIPFPSFNVSSNSTDFQFSFMALVSKYNEHARAQKLANYDHSSMMRHYSADLAEDKMLFLLFQQFGHDGLVPAVSYVFAQGTDEPNSNIILTALEQVVAHELDIVPTYGIGGMLNNMDTYSLLGFCRDVSFRKQLNNLALKTPGVLGLIMQAITKLAALNVSFDSSNNSKLNCTIAAIALSKNEFAGIPNFCHNERIKSFSNLAEYISEYKAQGNAEAIQQLEPVELVYNSILGSSVRLPNTGAERQEDALDKQEERVYTLCTKERPPSDSFTLGGAILLVLVLCIGAAAAFKLVKRKPESDIEAPPAEPEGGKAAPEAREESDAKAAEQTRN